MLLKIVISPQGWVRTLTRIEQLFGKAGLDQCSDILLNLENNSLVHLIIITCAKDSQVSILVIKHRLLRGYVIIKCSCVTVEATSTPLRSDEDCVNALPLAGWCLLVHLAIFNHSENMVFRFFFAIVWLYLKAFLLVMFIKCIQYNIFDVSM